MNVLVITPLFPNYREDPRGSFVLDSVEALAKEGHDVHVLVTRPYARRAIMTVAGRRSHPNRVADEIAQGRFEIASCRYIGIPASYARAVSNELYRLSCLRTAARLAARYKADVIHAHTDLAGYLACALRRRIQVPVVTTLHGLNTNPRYWHGWRQRHFFESVCRQSDRLVVVGEPLLEFVSQYVANDAHVRVVHNGFRSRTAARFCSRHVDAGSGVLRFISVSNLLPSKGVSTNLRALALLNASGFRGWRYDVVGDGFDRRNLQRLASELGLMSQITFRGYLDHDDMFALLNQAHVFSLPSAPEAFGVAYLEAMACGLLTIGARGQGPASFLTSGENGFLVTPGDHVALAGLFEQLMRAPASWPALARAGRSTAWSGFTWEAHARKLSRAFDEAVDQSRSRMVDAS